MPQNDILLIGRSDISDLFELVNTVSDDKVKAHIKKAQLYLVRPKICNVLYNEIVNQIINDIITSDNQKLLDCYIKPYLAALAFRSYLVWANTSSTKEGFMVFDGVNATQPTAEQIAALIADVNQTAAGAETELIHFLEANTKTYPKYDECNCRNEGETKHGANIYQFTSIGGRLPKRHHNNNIHNHDHDGHHDSHRH